MQTPQQKALQLQAQYHEVKKQIEAKATPWVFGLREGYVDGVFVSDALGELGSWRDEGIL